MNRPCPSVRNAVRPQLEVLEDRTVPAVNFAWANGLAASSGGLGVTVGITLATDAAGDVVVTGSQGGVGNGPAGPAFASMYSSSGALLWSQTLTSENAQGLGVAVDAGGNVLVVGTTFNANTTYAFVTKMDSAGNVQWSQQITAAAGEKSPLVPGIAVDPSGNVYVSGQYYDNATLGTFTLSNPGHYSSFIAKLDAAGNFLWAAGTTGGSATSSPTGATKVAVDGAGNAFVTGPYFGTVDFNPGTGTYNQTAAAGNQFVWKLDTNGAFVWAGSLGDAAATGMVGGDIKLDPAGNVYVTGTFAGAANDFDPGVGTVKLESYGQQDIFVAKLTPARNLVWARSLGGADMDHGYSLTVDSAGSVSVTGDFFTKADFDPTKAGKVFLTTPGGKAGIYVAILNSAGNYSWAGLLGGALTSRYTLGIQDAGLGIAVDGYNNIYTVGRFLRTEDFDPGTGTFQLTHPPYNMYLEKLTQGSPLLAASAPAKPTLQRLSETQVSRLLAEALARWQATGVDISALKNIVIRIANLPGKQLGFAQGDTITLDVNASGWGWFVDRTPGNDVEFRSPGDQGERGHMDLLSVLTHEVGHLLGRGHFPHGVMAETLDAGKRSFSSATDVVDGAFRTDYRSAARTQVLLARYTTKAAQV